MTFTVRDLQALTGFSKRQIHYWTDRGTLQPLATPGPAFAFDHHALIRVIVIKRMGEAGMSWPDIHRAMKLFRPAVVAAAISDSGHAWVACGVSGPRSKGAPAVFTETAAMIGALAAHRGAVVIVEFDSFAKYIIGKAARVPRVTPEVENVENELPALHARSQSAGLAGS